MKSKDISTEGKEEDRDSLFFCESLCTRPVDFIHSCKLTEFPTYLIQVVGFISFLLLLYLTGELEEPFT